MLNNIAPEDFIVEELPLYEPARVGTHTFFAIRKRNLSTLEAIDRIARELDISPRNFGYAGLKDKHAVTTQVLSVEGVPPARVLKLAHPAIEVLWAELHAHKLRVGHLRGNRFEITVRDFSENDLPAIKSVIERFATEGVPNRFGQQRFGNNNDSHLIGKALVTSEWDRIVRYMLADNTSPGRSIVRRMHRELARNAPERAVMCIPHRLRKLFLSAYQAYLFNCVLAARAPSLGKLLDGDLAVKHNNGACFLVTDTRIEQPRADALEISPSGPIFGYKTRLPANEVLALETSIFAAEGIRPGTFRRVAGIRLPGARRPLRMPLTCPKVSGALKGGVRLGFTLPAGGYATVVLEELLSDLESSSSGFEGV